jgi:hypothetical protein
MTGAPFGFGAPSSTGNLQGTRIFSF